MATDEIKARFLTGKVITCTTSTSVTVLIYAKGGSTPLFSPTPSFIDIGGVRWWVYNQNVDPGWYHATATCNSCGRSGTTPDKEVKAGSTQVVLADITLKPPCTNP